MGVTIRLDPKSWFSFEPESWKRSFSQGVKGSVSNKKRVAGTLAASAAVFLFTIFSSNPGYSLQMLTSGVEFWSVAFTTRFSSLLYNSGYAGVALTTIFSLLVGVTMTNTAVQLRMNRLDTNILGSLPGFLAGGCASCGVGVLSLLGFGGVLASMPFAGNSLRLGGVLLLAGLITRTGNPDTCKI